MEETKNLPTTLLGLEADLDQWREREWATKKESVCFNFLIILFLEFNL